MTSTTLLSTINNLSPQTVMKFIVNFVVLLKLLIQLTKIFFGGWGGIILFQKGVIIENFNNFWNYG